MEFAVGIIGKKVKLASSCMSYVVVQFKIDRERSSVNIGLSRQNLGLGFLCDGWIWLGFAQFGV